MKITVEYDGPSRPIVVVRGDIPPLLRMFSVSEFIDGKWTSFDDEEKVCQALTDGLLQEWLRGLGQ